MRIVLRTGMIIAILAVVPINLHGQERPRSTPRGMFGTAEQRRAWLEQLDQAEIEKDLQYKGMIIEIDPKAKGVERTIQQQIANLLSKQDSVPVARAQRFRFISEDLRTVITGWQCRITSLTNTPGGIVAKVHVVPRNDGNPTLHTNDYTIESYLFADGEIRYLGSEFPRTLRIICYN